jgi:hypothetical protein
LKIRFLADANRNQKIVTGLLLRMPEIDFGRHQNLIAVGMGDPEVLKLGATLGRLIVTHDVRTMPDHFLEFVREDHSPGLILVPKRMPIGVAIEELEIIWQASDAEEWLDQVRRLPL